MKAFIVSLCTVALLIGFTVINAAFINKVTCELTDVVQNIDNQSDLNEVRTMWESKRLFISISASHKEIDKIEEQLSTLYAAISNGDNLELEKSKLLLLDYIYQIRKHEVLSFENIL